MEVQRAQQLNDIIQLSREMLHKARDNEWDAVAQLEARRHELVMRCFQQPTSDQDAPQVASAIQEILRLNQEVSELGGAARNLVGTEIHTHSVGRAAQAAYSDCAR